MEYPEYLAPVLIRFTSESPKKIWCDEGWWTLIANCDKEISAIDTNYTIFQIKEKFGGLRYYCSPSNPIHGSKIDEVIRKYERICSMTCEVTGKHGYLMKKSFQYKTLNDSYLEQGWARVNE
jgi:hypothetical protein